MSRQHVLAVLGLCLIIALACYAAVIPSYFLSDDFGLIGRLVQDGMYGWWGAPPTGFLRPVMLLSFAVDHLVWSLDPVGYHLTNVFFHALAGFAVFLLAFYLFQSIRLDQPSLLAFLSALLFLALPCHSESVTWLSGRSDVLATAFGLLATVCFLSLYRRRSLVLGATVLIMLSMSLLAKESAIVIPILWAGLMAYHWLSTKTRPPAQVIATLVAASFCLLAYLTTRKLVIGSFVGGYGTEQHLAFFNDEAGIALRRFVLRTFLPALPPSARSIGESPAFLVVAGLAVTALGFLLVKHRRRLREISWPLVGTLTFCYFVALAPALPMGIQKYDTQGERFLYLPSVFACVLLVQVVSALIPGRRSRAITLAVLIAAEGGALQWVHTRWIVASQLSRQIAQEVSQTDPRRTIIMNVPDNFRGAYVFRNGLDHAASTFVGKSKRKHYRVLSRHSLGSLSDICEARGDAAAITLRVPEAQWLALDEDAGLDLRLGGNTLVALGLATAKPKITTVLYFRSGASRPMLETIDLGSRRPRAKRGRERSARDRAATSSSPSNPPAP